VLGHQARLVALDGANAVPLQRFGTSTQRRDLVHAFLM
jgi:hypothetical protein